MSISKVQSQTSHLIDQISPTASGSQLQSITDRAGINLLVCQRPDYHYTIISCHAVSITNFHLAITILFRVDMLIMQLYGRLSPLLIGHDTGTESKYTAVVTCKDRKRCILSELAETRQLVAGVQRVAAEAVTCRCQSSLECESPTLAPCHVMVQQARH